MTMDRYRCVKTFIIPRCDDDGRCSDDEQITIKEGTEWNDKGEAYVVLGKDGVHLETDNYSWLEITKDLFNEYFERVN